MKRARRSTVIALALAVGLLSAGLARADTMVKPADGDVTYWVKEALREDPRVNSADIKVETDDGIVKLTGSVRNLAEKQYAHREATKIRGVRGVVDEIEVKPESVPDQTIAKEIRQRLDEDPAIPGKDIGVTVKDGYATLEGVVSSYTEREEVYTAASEVAGLKGLNKFVRTEWEHKRSDADIRKDVAATLGRDVYLTDMPIQSTVKNGVVDLSGTVGTAYQKERAGNLAWTDNVVDVKNDLKVDPSLSEGVRAQHAALTDGQVRQSVYDAMFQDLRISEPYEIDVTASHGEVTLRGTVPTYSQRRLAEEDARDVVGVGWVTNLLMVDTEYAEDATTQTAVQYSLDTDWALRGEGIVAQVNDGVVTLKGDVPTFFDKDHASEVASRVKGVHDVINDVDVEYYSKYTDRSLAQRIEDRLKADWETSWLTPTIDVAVHDGKVTLTGEVDTWAERIEAGRVAFGTDGVYMVNNELAVKDTNAPFTENEYAGPYALGHAPHGYYYYHYLDTPY